MVLVTLAWTAALVFVCRAGGAGLSDDTVWRRLQQQGCDLLSLPERTQRVMDACCPPPPPLLPGEEPHLTRCDMPTSCRVPACAHEFLAFFEDCNARVTSAQFECELPPSHSPRRFTSDPLTPPRGVQSRPSTPSANASLAEWQSSTQMSSLPMTARRRARTPRPTAELASMEGFSAARLCSVLPVVSDVNAAAACHWCAFAARGSCRAVLLFATIC